MKGEILKCWKHLTKKHAIGREGGCEGFPRCRCCVLIHFKGVNSVENGHRMKGEKC